MPILRDEFDYPQEEDKQNKKHNYTFNPLRLPHPFTNLQLLNYPHCSSSSSIT